MKRMVRALLSSIVAASVLLAPTAAGASDSNVVFAGNDTDGAAVVEARVDFRKADNGVVDQENRAYASASCTDCQTLAVAFQIVLITEDPHTFTPENEAFALNVECDECVTWASAKQVLVVSEGPAILTGAGHARLNALERRLWALEADLPGLSLLELQAEVEDAFGELLAIADEEIVSDGGGNYHREIDARSA